MAAQLPIGTWVDLPDGRLGQIDSYVRDVKVLFSGDEEITPQIDIWTHEDDDNSQWHIYAFPIDIELKPIKRNKPYVTGWSCEHKHPTIDKANACRVNKKWGGGWDVIDPRRN